MDLDQRTRGIGGRSGRIILLGDGTEVLTDSDETEMFDHGEEDKDLASQVSKGQSHSTEKAGSQKGEEETSAPFSEQSSEKNHTPEQNQESKSPDMPSSNTTASPVTYIKAASDSALPTKLENPPQHKA